MTESEVVMTREPHVPFDPKAFAELVERELEIQEQAKVDRRAEISALRWEILSADSSLAGYAPDDDKEARLDNARRVFLECLERLFDSMWSMDLAESEYALFEQIDLMFFGQAVPRWDGSESGSLVADARQALNEFRSAKSSSKEKSAEKLQNNSYVKPPVRNEYVEISERPRIVQAIRQGKASEEKRKNRRQLADERHDKIYLLRIRAGGPQRLESEFARGNITPEQYIEALATLDRPRRQDPNKLGYFCRKQDEVNLRFAANRDKPIAPSNEDKKKKKKKKRKGGNAPSSR